MIVVVVGEETMENKEMPVMGSGSGLGGSGLLVLGAGTLLRCGVMGHS